MNQVKIFTLVPTITKRLHLSAIFSSIVHPSQLAVLLRDLTGLRGNIDSNSEHLKSVMNWLRCSQDNTNSGGCSGSYGFKYGWAPPYPETTGYIISTFLKYAKLVQDNDFLERAKRMGDWEIEIQLPSGAVRGGTGINDYGIVFNTGMVILGWIDLFQHTGNSDYLCAAIKASDWLCSILDDDGKWSRYTYNNIPHAYHARVSWALLEVHKHTNDSISKDIALKNIEWVLSLTQENGWINEMGFHKGEKPLTHTIAYTLRGLLECSGLVEEPIRQRILNAVLKAGEILMLKYEVNKKHPNGDPDFLAGRFDNRWRSFGQFSCLTGDAQIAIIWLRIYQLFDDARFLNAALKVVDQLKSLQLLKSRNSGIRGGIAGSYPIWGNYMPFCYPNWAAKFFADALMLLEEIMQEIE